MILTSNIKSFFVDSVESPGYAMAVERVLNAEKVAVDYETENTSSHPEGALRWWEPSFSATLVGVVWAKGEGCVVDIRRCPQFLQPLLKRRWIVHRADFEGSVTKQLTGQYPQILGDTKLLRVLDDQNATHKRSGLEQSAIEIFGAAPWKGEVEDYSAEKTQDPYWIERALKDADWTFQLYEELWKRLDEPRRNLHDKLLVPAALMLGEARTRGIYVSQERCQELAMALDTEIGQAMLDLRAAGWPADLNPSSTKQVAEVFYTVLGLPAGYQMDPKTNQRRVTTNDDHLASIEHLHPIVSRLRKYRELSKRMSTYTEYDLDSEGFTHTSYSLYDDRNGRTAASKPALQQIPKPTEDPRCRAVFVAPAELLWYGADLSQIELRIAAAISLDPVLLDACRTGKDIHSVTAQEIMGFDPAKFTKDEWKKIRSKAKPVNFGFLYGQQPKGFVDYALKDYGVRFTLAEAITHRNNYFRKYAGLGTYHANQEKLAYHQGFVTSLTGRKYSLPGAFDSDPFKRSLAVRQAINYPISGASSDIFLMGCVEAWQKGFDLRLLVHDFAGGYIPEDLGEFEQTEYLKEFQKCLESPSLLKTLGIELPVPLEAEVKTGHNWSEL